MTKTELIRKIAGRHPQTSADDAKQAVGYILEALGKAMSRGQHIEIRDFGSFDRAPVPGRSGRNPMTGERIEIPAGYRLRFKAGKALRERIRPLGTDHSGGGAAEV